MHVAQRRALFPVQPDFIMRRIKWAPDVITSYPPDWSGHGVVEWHNDSDVASAESSSPVTCNPALPTFTLLGQGDSLPSYSLVVRKGEPLGSRWMRTRTVYADPKSEPNQRGSSSLPRCQLPTTSPSSSSLSRSTGLACPQLVSPLVSSSTPTNWRLNSLIRFR